MKIVKQLPPNIKDIQARFGFVVLNPGVVFTYGDTIYNPSGVMLPAWLVYHESIHSGQQGDKADPWWSLYLSNDTFRLEQEMLAHAVEYAVFSKMNPHRHIRQGALVAMAKRLSGPLYGKMIPFGVAKAQIKKLTPAVMRGMDMSGAGRLSGQEAGGSAAIAVLREPLEGAGAAEPAG